MEKRVGFGPRLVAALIDAVIIMVLALVFGGMVGGLLGLGVGAAVGANADSGSAAAGGAAGALLGALGGFLIGSAVFGFLYSLIEGLTGASPGKMVLKLKVGTESGRNATLQVYLTRWAVKYSGQLLGFLAILTGIGLLRSLGSLASLVIFVGCFLVLGASRQAIHDMAAKTAVFNRADLT